MVTFSSSYTHSKSMWVNRQRAVGCVEAYEDAPGDCHAVRRAGLFLIRRSGTLPLDTPDRVLLQHARSFSQAQMHARKAQAVVGAGWNGPLLDSPCTPVRMANVHFLPAVPVGK